MATLLNFDQYYNNYPEIKRELDFGLFWKNALSELKQFPIDPEFREQKRRSNRKFIVYDVSYKSFLKTTVNGRLYIPVKSKTPPKPVILVHDYMNIEPFKGYGVSPDFAYLFLELRGHHIIKNAASHDSKGGSIESPGFMVENILDPDNYYLKGVYLDVLRSVEVLRLNRDLDSSSMAIIGKGLGGAAAVFAAAYSNRIKAVVLDSLNFADLETSQNLSTGYISEEINTFANKVRGKKKILKRNLTYFDAVNFADRLSECPILMTTGTKTPSSPTECVFSFFNYIPTEEKTIEIYPDEGIEAGGNKQFQKSLKWIGKFI